MGATDYLTDEEISEDGAISRLLSDTAGVSLLDSGLRKIEEKYKCLFDKTYSANVMLDAEGRIVEANDACCRLLGCEACQVLGSRAFDWVIPDQRDKVVELFQRTLAGERTLPVAMTVNGFRGKKRKILFCQGSPVFTDENKGPSAVLFSGIDITPKAIIREQLEKSRCQLRELSTYLVNLREEERMSIAREIHDQLGQYLTVLKIELDVIGRQLEKSSPHIVEKVKNLISMADESLEITQNLVSRLRPEILDELGLVSAVCRQVKEFENHTGISCEVINRLNEKKPGKELTTAIFKILQEALTNVARHSDATKVRVVIAERDGYIDFSVSDNGRGITERCMARSGSFGLLGIAERVKMRGGKFNIQSTPNEGTSLCFLFPMASTEERNEETADCG